MQIYNDKIFTNQIEKIIAFDNESFISALKKIEKYKNENKFLLGYIRYSAKEIFLNKKIKSTKPLLYFEVFNSFEKFDEEKNPKKANLYNESEISFEKYQDDLKKIKNYISLGDTYEVNYTYPYKVYSDSNSLELYNYLLQKQKTPYNAFIQNEFEEILSFSPELFFKIKNNKIITKPMKGTIKRGKGFFEDRKNYNFLKNDIKNQAENVMIVDLLRNDLSKISKTSSTHVDKLFEIEKHKTLYQMTSEISSILEENITLFDILKALFPCGSITGAPKVSTMNIIDELEEFNREIYCGAIGFISKNETIFSVPIRILQKENGNNFYKYYVGGAIVWDSDIIDEWNETLTKKKIIDSEVDFQLIETMLVENNQIFLFEYHLNRIKVSSKKLGFKFNENDFKFNTENDCLIRFLLSKDGKTKIEYKKLNEIKSNKIKLSNNKLNSKNQFLYDKTTYRPWYSIDLEDYFDIIFLNEKDELIEGARSNIVLELNGKLYTPPISCGLLNGTYRKYLIDNKKIFEKVLYKDDLLKAQKIYCINSVRKMVEVKYDFN